MSRSYGRPVRLEQERGQGRGRADGEFCVSRSRAGSRALLAVSCAVEVAHFSETLADGRKIAQQARDHIRTAGGARNALRHEVQSLEGRVGRCRDVRRARELLAKRSQDGLAAGLDQLGRRTDGEAPDFPVGMLQPANLLREMVRVENP